MISRMELTKNRLTDITVTLHSGHVCSMQRGSTVETMGTIWGSTAMLHVLL